MGRLPWLVWKSGDELLIQSRDLKPLGRYFPELEVTLRGSLPDRCVLDGEIVIATGGRLDFEALLLRIHPAASRVAALAAQSPSSYVAWDLLALSDEDLRELPQIARRERLVAALAGAQPPVHVTPATRDRAVATDWFQRFEGAGLDGVIAKPDSLPYTPDKRVMLKIKHQRTAECVVAGFRWFKGGKGKLVGSLLLGLYDAEGVLHHVGVCSSFKQAERAALAEKLAQRDLELGEVAAERLQVAALEVDLVAALPDQRTKPVPLRLVDKALALAGQLDRQLGEHRLDRRLKRQLQGHRATVHWRRCARS